jgi:hypothetical protein
MGVLAGAHWNDTKLVPDQNLDMQVVRDRGFAEDMLVGGATFALGVAGLLILAWLLIVFIRQGWRARSPGGGVSVMFGVALFATALVNAPFRDAALGMTLLWLLAVSRSAQGGAAHA